MKTKFKAIKLHRDKTATIWDVYSQQWIRSRRPSDQILASLSPADREKVTKHLGI